MKINNKLLIFFIIIIAILAFHIYYMNRPGIIISRLSKKENIQLGNLRYKIYLLGALPVGEVVITKEKIEEYKGKEVYHLQAMAQSFRLFSKFFNISAILDSYVDTQQCDPIFFKQVLKITGQKDINREISYDQNRGIMYIGNSRRQILDHTQDPLSLVLNIKRMDLNKVRELQMNINTNQTNYRLRAEVEKKAILIKKEIHNIIFINGTISRYNKNPYHKSTIGIVLWQRKENIPLYIKVFSGGVLVDVRLVDIK